MYTNGFCSIFACWQPQIANAFGFLFFFFFCVFLQYFYGTIVDGIFYASTMSSVCYIIGLTIMWFGLQIVGLGGSTMPPTGRAAKPVAKANRRA